MMSEWGVPLVVTGLLLATLFMASLVKRHQLHQAEIRARVRRLESGCQRIQQGLANLAPVPLSKELRITLRGDVLARYQRIRRLYRKYPALQQRIIDAENALNGEGAPAGTDVGAIESERLLRAVLSAIDGIVDILATGTTVQPIPADVRKIFCRELGERRAEVLSRFHLTTASRLHGEGNSTEARAHVTTLLQLLRQRGPSTDFVRALYTEAEAALEDIGNGRPLGSTSDDAEPSLSEATG